MTPLESTIFSVFLMMFAFYTGKNLGRNEGIALCLQELIEEIPEE